MQAMAKLETAADVKEKLLDKKFAGMEIVTTGLVDFEERSKKLHDCKRGGLEGPTSGCMGGKLDSVIKFVECETA